MKKLAAESLSHRTPRSMAMSKGTAAGSFPSAPKYDVPAGVPAEVSGGSYKDNDDALPRESALPASSDPWKNIKRG